MDTQQRRVYYNFCNPDLPLDPENQRNVNLDELGDPDEPVRGLNWGDKLATEIEFSVGDDAIEKPACMFFTGLPGSGKSTEIWRLASRLRKQANLLPVRIDAEDTVDLSDSIDISDIRVAILYHTEREVLRAEGKDPDDGMKDGALKRVTSLLDRLRIEGTKADLILPGAKLALEMRVQPTLRQEIRRRVAAHTTAFLRDTDVELEQLKGRARRCGFAGLVVLFDSLEKLRGISTNFVDVLNSAERLFAEGAPYLRLPVHVLYTIPPALILRLRCPVEFMPMIKLWHRDDTSRRFEPGFEAARIIIRRRISDPTDLRFIFGATDDAELNDRLDRLITWSAGYPREIIRLLRNAIAQAPLSGARFRRLLGQAGDDYRRLLLASDFDWLARVALEHNPTPKDEVQRLAADRMFANNIVLRYQNDSEWYEVHPAVREMPGLQEAMARRRAEKVGFAPTPPPVLPHTEGQG